VTGKFLTLADVLEEERSLLARKTLLIKSIQVETNNTLAYCSKELNKT
jgi:hypothetical protein